jgi:hypothetical protein
MVSTISGIQPSPTKSKDISSTQRKYQVSHSLLNCLELAVARAAISKLKKPDGTYYEPSAEDTDVLTIVFHQTSDVRLRVIAATLKKGGVELDETTKSLLRQLFNPAAVEEKLKAMKNPQKKTLRDFLS